MSTTATASASALTTSSSNITAKDTHAAGGSAQFIQNENINSSSQAGLNLFELSANERFSPTQDNNQIQYNLNTRKAESEAIKFSGLGAEQHKPLQQPEIFWNSNLKDNNIHAIATPAAIATTFSATDMNSLKLQKRADFGAIMNIQLAGLNATIMGNPVTWKEGGNVIIHVSLKKQPNAKVIAHFKISDEKLATVKPARIEFNPANWYIEQEVTVIGLDGKPGTVNNDESISGGIQYELIILPLESSDSSYRELESANITLWALDKSPYGN